MEIKIKGNYKILVLIILAILALAILITSYQLSRKDNISSEKSSALVINEDLIADFDYNSWYLNNTSYNPATLFGPWALASHQDELYIGFGTGRPAELDGAAIAYYKKTTSANSIRLITNAQGTNPIREQGIHRINKHNNKLYIPGTDACCGQNNNLGSNYILDTSDKSVTTLVIGDSQDVVSHVWGITVAPDGKMYSTTSSWDGLVFESIDNGLSWQKVYTIHSDESVTRAMDIKWFMGKLYLVTYEYNPANVNDIRSRKLLVSSDNARSWNLISNVIPRHLDRFIEYKNGLIIGSVDDTKLISIDSNGIATNSSPMGFQMEGLYTANRYDTDGDYIYAIGLLNKIYRSNDLTNWELFASYTNTGSVFLSIHYWAYENSIIVGTRGGNIKVLKYAIEDTAPQNQPPVVNAGVDETITLPSSASLVGTATDDRLPNPPATLTKTWSKVTGAGTVIFSDVNNLSTTASFSSAGVYTLRLTVSDGALTTTDDVMITVNSAPPTGTVEIPTFSPLGGTFTTAQSVTITTATSGATIRYTVNGTTPSQTNGTVYSGAITLTATTTLKAIAYKTGMTNSNVASATYTNISISTNRVATPVIGPTTTAFTTSVLVSITSATAGATIRYTTNGTTPSTTNGTEYTGAFTLTSQTTVRAIAYKTGMTNSYISTRTYTNRVATPVISPTTTTFGTSVSVSLTTSTSGATIRYTTNGTTPSTTNGTVYTGAFTLTSQTTVKAIAYKTGMTNSYIATRTYTNRVATPVISPTTTSFTTSVSVSITSATAGATIRYTTDGTTPSPTNGTVYTGAFTLTSSTRVRAIAYKTGMTNSYISTRTYINRVATPVISPTTTSFTTSVSVSITTATAGATIRYTTNGTTPSLTNGTVYTAPFTLTSQTTVKAIAYKTGMTNSYIATRTYTKSTTVNY